MGRFFHSNPGLDATFGERTVVRNTVVARDLCASDPMREAGTGRIAVLHTLVVAEGQILALIAVSDPNDPANTQFFAMMRTDAATPAAGTPVP